MNNVSKQIDIKEYMKKLEKTNSNIIEQVCIINTDTGEFFPTNERNALSDFERISRKRNGDWSIFYPVNFMEGR